MGSGARISFRPESQVHRDSDMRPSRQITLAWPAGATLVAQLCLPLEC